MDKFAGLSKATLGNASNSEDSNSYINGAAFESFLKSYREMNKVEPQYPTNDKPKVSRMIAHKYFIEDPDHSFHKLHNKTGSIDIDKIINDDFDPNTVNYFIKKKHRKILREYVLKMRKTQLPNFRDFCL